MYALLLAGGFATRLWPLTKDYPKPLLPLGPKRIIEFSADQIVEMEHIRRIFISTNSVFEQDFARWAKQRYPDKPIELIAEPSAREEQKFGTIRAMKYDLDEILSSWGPDDMLILAGDNVFSLNLLDLIEFYKRVRAPVVAAFRVKSIEEARRFGVISVDEGSRIVEFEEKPERPKSTLIATAIYLLPRDMLDCIGQYLEEGRNPDAPGYFFSWLSKRTDVYAYVFTGFWYDIGTLNGYLEALRSVLSRSHIEGSADIRGRIVAPVFIGAHVLVDESSVVGPYAVIEDEVSVRGSELSRVLIMSQTSIAHTKISDSMIGMKATISGGRITGSIIASHTKLNIG